MVFEPRTEHELSTRDSHSTSASLLIVNSGCHIFLPLCILSLYYMVDVDRARPLRRPPALPTLWTSLRRGTRPSLNSSSETRNSRSKKSHSIAPFPGFLPSFCCVYSNCLSPRHQPTPARIASSIIGDPCWGWFGSGAEEPETKQ